ncbi:thioredoxin domain-containing protein [Streptomyces sp. bgisy100]|uniref:thioredoxin domain-containing protein n=1 Tax=Streptomyces sp. bgisy100 TaxID=3413783 RepID=UPI003D703B10
MRAKKWPLIAAALVPVLTAGCAGAGDDARAGAMDAPVVSAPVSAPAHTNREGTAVVYGKADAAHVLAVYLDLRCPHCGKAETALGPTMRKLADQGMFKIEYHFATFLDGSLGGSGSARALNALGAAADRGQRTFGDYLHVLSAHQPARNDDAFGSPRTLLELADRVDGLRAPGFDRAVEREHWMPWVKKVSKAFYTSGVSSTPTVQLDGAPLTVLTGRGETVGPARFAREVRNSL